MSWVIFWLEVVTSVFVLAKHFWKKAKHLPCAYFLIANKHQYIWGKFEFSAGVLSLAKVLD